MMWLRGPAGAGKSAIVQTIAELCKERGVQAASFFFFRTDPTRSTARSFVATLLYQIIKFYPPARQAIATVLSSDPLLFTAPVRDQFDQLLSAPVWDISQPPEHPVRRPIVLLIDGLDECDSENKTSQLQILKALDHLLLRTNCPFLVLVASRAEPHLVMAFKELSSRVQSVFLDNDYAAEKDIRVFVTGEFNRIKKSHPFAHTLGDDWPLDKDVESIVTKSSGQFIFAATAMRYLGNPSASPILSLQRVQGIAPVATNLPFANLDAMYIHIFSQADDREAVMDLLSGLSLNRWGHGPYGSDPSGIKQLLHAYNSRYTPDLLDSCLANMTAIMKFDKDDLEFFHASLPDFLEDQARAGDYYVDTYAFSVKIFPTLWRISLEWRPAESIAEDFLTELKTPTCDITTALKTVFPTSLISLVAIGDLKDPILQSIHRLVSQYNLSIQSKFYYPHDIKTYKKIIHRWISLYTSQLYGRDHNSLSPEARSLPYVMFYVRISRLEHWLTRKRRSLQWLKK